MSDQDTLKRTPAEQARLGRCGATHQFSSKTVFVCSRWRGHIGEHRGRPKGEFYGGVVGLTWCDSEMSIEKPARGAC